MNQAVSGTSAFDKSTNRQTLAMTEQKPRPIPPTIGSGRNVIIDVFGSRWYTRSHVDGMIEP